MATETKAETSPKDRDDAARMTAGAVRGCTCSSTSSSLSSLWTGGAFEEVGVVVGVIEVWIVGLPGARAVARAVTRTATAVLRSCRGTPSAFVAAIIVVVFAIDCIVVVVHVVNAVVRCGEHERLDLEESWKEYR